MANIGMTSPDIVFMFVERLQAFAVTDAAIANWDIPFAYDYNDRGAIKASFHSDLVRLPEVELCVTTMKRTREGETLEREPRLRSQSGRSWKVCADWIWLSLHDVVNFTVESWHAAVQSHRQVLQSVKELRGEVISLRDAERGQETELRWLQNGGQQWNSTRISWSLWLNAKQILSVLAMSKEQLLKDGKHAVQGSKKFLLEFVTWLRTQVQQRRDSLLDLQDTNESRQVLIMEAQALDTKLENFQQNALFANTDEVDLEVQTEVFLAGLAFDFEVNKALVGKINQLRLEDLEFATSDVQGKSLPQAVMQRLEELDPLPVNMDDYRSFASFQSLMPLCVTQQVLDWSQSDSAGSQIANHWDLASLFDPQDRRLDTFTDKMGPLKASYDQLEALDQANADLVESLVRN